MYFHRTERHRTAMVCRRCSVAVDIVVGVVGLMLRGGPLIRSIFDLSKVPKKILWPQNLLSGLCSN